MITEDYVSFETAKLLKEKGFDWNCESKRFYPEPDYDQESPDGVYAPTLQMAMKWLREVHNLCLEPYRTACGYLCDVARVPSGSEIYGQDNEGDDEDSGEFTTYEKSCEAAIKYCLENLI